MEKKILILIVIFTAILSTILVYVYLVYRSSIQFAPAIFFTELIKFFVATVTWTVLIKYFEKVKQKQRNSRIINGLLFHLNELINEINNNNLKHMYLTNKLYLIINNIGYLRISAVLNESESIALSIFETAMTSSKIQEEITNIEYHIEKEYKYNQSSSIETIIDTLNNLYYVFGNKATK